MSKSYWVAIPHMTGVSVQEVDDTDTEMRNDKRVYIHRYNSVEYGYDEIALKCHETEDSALDEAGE